MEKKKGDGFMLEIDVRGLSCPIPVIKTKQAIEKDPHNPIVVLLDSEVSKENVVRLATSMGYTAKAEQISGEYRLRLEPDSK